MYCRKRSLILLFVLFISFTGRSQDLVFNVKKYGAAGDGRTLDTKAFNKTIAACAKAGGGTVFVPAGTFVIGSVQLFSNIDLHLSSGAVLLASDNTNDYGMQSEYGFGGSGAGGKKLGLLYAVNADNVSVTGTGTIDGRAEAYMYFDSVQVSSEEDSRYTRQGRAYMNAPEGKKEAPVMWKGAFIDRPGTQLIFHACRKVLIRDITIRNANDWTMDLNKCDDAKVLGISIQNNMSVPNSDGIDMYDSKNVVVADCDVRVGDDAMAVISTTNLTVTNCNFYSRSCGIRVGYNGFNDDNSGNLLFDNIRIYGSNRGVGIFQRRKGDISNMLFSNMIIDTRLYPGQWWGHGEPIHISAVPGLGSKDVGTISNVRFSNIIASGEEGIVLYGSEESVLKDIRFDNVQLTIKNGPMTRLYGGNFDLRATNDPRMGLFKHDIPAVYARDVKGLQIKGLDLRWEGDLPDFFTSAISCERFQDLLIEGLNGSTAPHATDSTAVIDLRDGKGAVIRDGSGVSTARLRSGDHNARWVSQQNVQQLVVSPIVEDETVGSYGQRPGSLSYMDGQPGPTASTNSNVGADRRQAIAGFVQRDGLGFTLDGKPYYYIGANYWQGALLANSASGSKGRLRVQRELSFLAAHGVTNLRIVAGSEGVGAINGSWRVGPSLQPKKGVFSESALEGLDFLLSEMAKRKMKAVIYLSNNWDWSGGFLQYLNWNGRLADSLFHRKLGWDELRDHTSQFYTCSSCEEDYYRQVRRLVSRTNTLTKRKYTDEPAIMAWELANEPRPMRPSSYTAYKDWVHTTAALIKSLDTHHLVTTGTEGMASTDDDIELYTAIHNDPNVDYLTIHVWPKNWGFFQDTAIAAGMPVIIRNTQSYIAKHEAIARRLNKPMVIEEFGLPRDRQAFDAKSPDSLRKQYFELLFTIVANSIAGKSGLAGCNFWAFGGEGRPKPGQAFWKPGDTYLGDPPMEEQGLNAVYDSDAALWQMLTGFSLQAPFH